MKKELINTKTFPSLQQNSKPKQKELDHIKHQIQVHANHMTSIKTDFIWFLKRFHHTEQWGYLFVSIRQIQKYNHFYCTIFLSKVMREKGS